MSVVVSEAMVEVERALICEAERDEMMDIDAQAFSFASAASENERFAAARRGALSRVRVSRGLRRAPISGR